MGAADEGGVFEDRKADGRTVLFTSVEVPIAISDADFKILLSLRPVLCDPITGDLMEDAMVTVSCGHSFGGTTLQRVAQTNVCLTCGAPTGLLVPNFALRSAVKAFREKEIAANSSKRKREQEDEPQHSDCKRPRQDPLNSSENTGSSEGKSKGGQFPFSVNDHVLIKGNKRTPERFCGKEAVIATQCLNGWYLVRTIDGGENIRLQYRSLEKIEDVQQSSDSEEVAKARKHAPVAPKSCSSAPVDVKVDKQPFVVINSQRIILPWQASFTLEDGVKQDGGAIFTKWLRVGDDKRGVVAFSTESNQLEDSQGTSQIYEDHQGRTQHSNPCERYYSLLRALKKDMLQLEKRVPWNLLRLPWKDCRLQWRSKIRQSRDVKDISNQVNMFRRHLLLASAGGLSDEQWQIELASVADIDSLVILWRRLSEDVLKLLNSKTKSDEQQQKDFDLKEVQAAFPNLCVEGMSVVSVIAATILASADAIARGEKDADEILEIPMKLIQQHGRQNLRSIREALEREKRHLTAKLSHLGEDGYNKLPFLAHMKAEQKVVEDART